VHVRARVIVVATALIGCQADKSREERLCWEARRCDSQRFADSYDDLDECVDRGESAAELAHEQSIACGQAWDAYVDCALMQFDCDLWGLPEGACEREEGEVGENCDLWSG
jgi:hypothetical protein